MQTDVKRFNRQGDCFRRCGTLTLKAQSELDATLLAMLARAITNDNDSSRVKLYRSLMAEFPEHDQPEAVMEDELLKEFAHLGG